MAATPSILVRKSAEYEGGTREFSNRYHFLGGTPADLTHWTTLSNNVVAAEKLASPGRCSFIESVCYAAGSDVPLYTITLSGTGSYSGGSNGIAPPLEVCALIRYSTDQRTGKNHPIYLFSYMRCTVTDVTVGPEFLKADLKTALTTYAAAWVSGFSDGTNTYNRAGPNGAAALAEIVDEYVTHRDFPR